MTAGSPIFSRFYNLLVGLDDGVTWRLYTYRDGYLSISPKAWSPDDLPGHPGDPGAAPLRAGWPVGNQGFNQAELGGNPVKRHELG